MNSVSFSGIIRFVCVIGFLGLSALRADTTYGNTFTADPVFQPKIEHVGYINAVALSRTLVMAGTTSTYPLDGKYYAGGSFTKIGTLTRAYFARYNSDATVDTTFNIAGTGFDDQVRAVVVQSDGKILVGGDFTSFNGLVRGGIARLNADGTVDSTFVPGIGFNGSVRSLALQADGKIVVGGSFTKFGTTTQNYIARLTATGALDTFNIGTGFDASVYAVALQTDGKIVVGGSFVTFNAVGSNRIVRLNTDGTLDGAFTTATASGFNGQVNALAVQTDGMIVAGGEFTTFDLAATYFIARLATTGLRDTTFVSGADDAVYTIGFQTVGTTQHILVGGAFTAFNGATCRRIARVDTFGWLDGPYEVDSSGNVVTTTDAAGTTIPTVSVNWFNPGLGFNSNVFSVLSTSVTDTSGTSLRVIAGGIFSSFDGFPARGLVRTTTNGAPAVASSSDLSRAGAVRFAQQIDGVINKGKFIVAGSFSLVNGKSQYFIAQLNANGTVDANFYRGAGFRGNGVNAVLVDTDATSRNVNSILLGGSFTVFNGSTQSYIARLYSDGSLQASSSAGAHTTTFTDATTETVTTTTLTPDGAGVGGTTTRTITTKPKGGTATSVTDTVATNTLSPDLLVWFYPGVGFDASVNALAFQTVGATDYILAGGAFTTLNIAPVGRIARLAKLDGTPDTAFTTAAGTGFDAAVNAIAIQSVAAGTATESRILVGGEFLKFNDATSTSCKYIARLNTGGSLDTAFVPDATVFDGAVKAIAVKTDAVLANVKIYVGGKFTRGIVRLNYNGTVDTTFATGTGFTTLGLSAEIEAITLQGDGKIIVTGDFDKYNGTAVSGIARLNPNGSLDATFSLPDVTDRFAYGVAFTTETTPRLILSGASTSTQVGLAVLRPDNYSPPVTIPSSSSSSGGEVVSAAAAASSGGGGGAPSGLYFALVGIAALARFVNRSRQQA